MKKVSPKQLKDEALDKLARYKRIRVICSAKALDEGVDVPNVEMGVIMARTQTPRQTIQRMGRIVRKHKLANGAEKQAIIVNLYMKGTKEAKWLERAQKGQPGVIWADSIDEIFNRERLEIAR